MSRLQTLLAILVTFLLGVIVGSAVALNGGLAGTTLSVGFQTTAATLRMSLDWFQNHSALSVALAALAGGIAVAQLRRNYQQDRSTAMRDCLWHFLDRWDKVTVGYEQAKDALKLFNNMAELPDQATTETVYGLLNFFDSLGRMANHHHIDDDITWFYFHDDAHELWELAEKYVTSERLTAGDLGITWWQDYESWVVRIRRIEDSECKKQKKRAEKSARRRGLTSPPGPPTSQPGPPTSPLAQHVSPTSEHRDHRIGPENHGAQQAQAEHEAEGIGHIR